jgi:hypothetical protein
MIVENQMVNVSWNNNNVEHYENLGFIFTKIKDRFNVDVSQLPNGSNLKVLIKCDQCGTEKLRSYAQALKDVNHFCSKICSKDYCIYTKEQLVDEFYKFKEDHNRYPECSEMQVNKGYLSSYYYIKVWGSWSNFLEENNIHIISNRDTWSEDDKNTLFKMYPTERKEDIVTALEGRYNWNSISTKAGILGIKRKCLYTERGHSKQYLIDQFWNYYREHNVYPYAKQLKNPTQATYTRVFGSWATFLKELGIMGSNDWYFCDEDVLRENYEKKTQEEIIEKLMIKRKWNSIKHKASELGLKRSGEVRRKFSDEFLISELGRFYNEFGKVPTNEDFTNDKNFPSPKCYQKRFGSWNESLVKAGLNLNNIMKHSRELIIEDTLNFYKLYNRSPMYNELKYKRGIVAYYWDTWNNLLKECGLPVTIEDCKLKSKGEGIDFLIDLYKKLKRVPIGKDLDDIPFVHRAWFARIFGSWTNALIESGILHPSYVCNREEMIEASIRLFKKLSENLERIPTVEEFDNYVKNSEERAYTRRNLCEHLGMTYFDMCDEYLDYDITNENGYGRVCINKLGKRCKSVPEVNISNILIDNAIVHLYEPRYKDVILTEDCRYKFDWCIDNKNGEKIYVEYFGLYTDDKNQICQDYVVKTDRKILLCDENNIELISLFREDLNDGYNGLLKKFKVKGIELNIG